MNEKLTERPYTVGLLRQLIQERWSIESALTITVTAVSTAQAQRKAEDELPGWTANSVA